MTPGKLERAAMSWGTFAASMMCLILRRSMLQAASRNLRAGRARRLTCLVQKRSSRQIRGVIAALSWTATMNPMLR